VVAASNLIATRDDACPVGDTAAVYLVHGSSVLLKVFLCQII
jgi:hypothetical protein